MIGIQHCLTLAYSEEENAIVERMNKEINRHLRALTFDNTSLENYPQSLPFVQRIIKFESQRSFEDISCSASLWQCSSSRS